MTLDDVPWIGAEAKPPANSLCMAYPQGFMTTGDVALALHRSRVRVDDCAVPLAVFAGDTIQICAASLLPGGYPSFCSLSRALCIYERDDLFILGEWLTALAWFARETVTRAKTAGFSSAGLARTTDPTLDVESLFFKPVRASGPPSPQGNTSTHRADVAQILDVYQCLYDKLPTHLRGSIEFPLGTIQIGADDGAAKDVMAAVIVRIQQTIPRENLLDCDTARLTPLLVYHYLGAPWSSTPPPPKTPAADLYVHAVGELMTACTDAGVVFLDLRPDNIMWMGTDSKVSVRLIDFEHVVLASTVVRAEDIDTYRADRQRRYCSSEFIFDTDDRPSLSINKHWVTAITDFLDRNDPDEDFDSCMAARAPGGGGSSSSSSSHHIDGSGRFERDRNRVTEAVHAFAEYMEQCRAAEAKQQHDVGNNPVASIDSGGGGNKSNINSGDGSSDKPDDSPVHKRKAPSEASFGEDGPSDKKPVPRDDDE